jgi:hypothetical protein
MCVLLSGSDRNTTKNSITPDFYRLPIPHPCPQHHAINQQTKPIPVLGCEQTPSHPIPNKTKQNKTRPKLKNQSPLLGLNLLLVVTSGRFSLPSLAGSPATVLRFIGNLLSPPKTCEVGIGCVSCLLSSGGTSTAVLLSIPSCSSSFSTIELLATTPALATLTSTSRNVVEVFECELIGRVAGAEEGCCGNLRTGGVSAKTCCFVGLLLLVVACAFLVGLVRIIFLGERLPGDLTGEAGRLTAPVPPRMRSRRFSRASVRGSS